MNEKIVVNSEEKVKANLSQISDEQLIKIMMKDMSFEEFVTSPAFIKAVDAVAKQRNANPVDIAKGFVDTALGTVNTFGITSVNTVQEFVDNIIDLLHGTLKGVSKTTGDLGRGLVNTITLQGGK